MVDRRTFIATTAAATATAPALAAKPPVSSEPVKSTKPAGRLTQSVCRWCYGRMPIDELCKAAAEIGYASVELLGPDEWDAPSRHGLTCAVATFVKANPIPRGFNRVEHHDSIEKELEAQLPLVKARGIPNQIVFSGNRAGMADAEAIENCVKGLRRIVPLAESLGVTLVMELLNSKVDHGDYHADRTAFGVEIVKGVGSPRFKLLYDIYHMQIMEGDVIRTITDNLEHIGHFHTGGVPGRAEIDGTQELNYAAICRAIADKGFTGAIGQEFMPRRDPVRSLREAFEICRV